MHIDIIAPSAAISPEDIHAIRTMLVNWGFKPNIPDNMIGDDIICANTDEIRFEQLKHALYNEESTAVWCVRGGYGCTRLLSKLAELKPPKHPKLVIGCSDITALHIFLQQKWGWPTLHAAGAKQAALKEIAETDILAIKNILEKSPSNPPTNFPYPLVPMNTAAKKTTKITSTITGGNLCLVQASIGTFWQIEVKHKILFLEDVNERGYKIDRMLEHLRQAGILDGLDAIILGDFIGGDEHVDAVLQRFADSCPYPVLRCTGVGHGVENHPIMLGTPSTLELGTAS